MENSYQRTIFFDIETAGLEMDAPIIEVAAIAVETGTYRVIDTIDMKIEFEMRYLTDYKALGINKFSAETWAKYALPGDVAAQKLDAFFRRYATEERISKKSGKPYYTARLGGHNSNAFDAPRIQRLFEKHDLFFHPGMLRTLDTEQAARWFFENNQGLQPPDNYQLGTLVKYLSLDVDPNHTALADTFATVDLARALAELNRVSTTTQAA